MQCTPPRWPHERAREDAYCCAAAIAVQERLDIISHTLSHTLARMLSTAVSRNRHSLLDDPHSPGLLPVLVEVRVDLLGELPPHDVVQRNVNVVAIAANDLRGSTAYATPDGDGLHQ